MQRSRKIQRCDTARRLSYAATCAVIVSVANCAVAAPYVEFDFARAIECRDVTPAAFKEHYSKQRLVELTLPMSVRFRGLSAEDVDELDIEINGSAAGLRVYGFSPSTQLASDIAKHIEMTTTTKRARSLEATLGGELPLPYAEVVAHVAPSINAGISGSEVATEKMNRLPPKLPVVVSGTSSEGRGVFFKLKRSSQTSLEGVHPLSVTFVVPPGWRGDDIRVGCSASGRRKVMWIKQQATLGRAAGTIRLQLAGSPPAYQVAKPVTVATTPETGPASFLAAAAAEVIDMMDGPDWAAGPEPAKSTDTIVIEDGAKAGL
jgi:hypothetical protein